MGVYILGKDKKYWNGKHGARPFLIRTNSEDLTRHPHIPSHHISHHHHHPPPMSRPSWIHDMAAMDGKKKEWRFICYTLPHCKGVQTGVDPLEFRASSDRNIRLEIYYCRPIGIICHWSRAKWYIDQCTLLTFENFFFFLFVIGLLLIHWINKIKVKILKRLECIRGGWSTGPFLSQSIWDGMPNVS